MGPWVKSQLGPRASGDPKDNYSKRGRLNQEQTSLFEDHVVPEASLGPR